MIKLVYCITRKSGMSQDKFRDYWKNVHGPIGASIPGLRRLVQSHSIHIQGDQHPGDFDGMAELWFDNEQALLKARRSPEWQLSSVDEENFVDHKRVAYFVSEEIEIPLPGAGS
jgi:uncharacterized protein (TIGR02118 family)